MDTVIKKTSSDNQDLRRIDRKRAFMKGFFSIFNFYGVNLYEQSYRSDHDAILSDWLSVGQDLRQAIDNYQVNDDNGKRKVKTTK